MPKKKLILPVLLFSLQAFGAEQLTGLKPITTKELRRMEKELGMRRIKEIRPNELGLKRINAERLHRNLPEVPKEHAVKPGKDTLVDPTETIDDVMSSVGPSLDASSEDFFAGVLPASVDNSILPAFPSIGQQRWNSCVAWALGYYQWSHNNALALGWNNKTDLTKKCSPKFVYNMINAGVDSGAYFSDALSMVQKHGCVPNSVWPEDTSYRAWNTDQTAWQAAIPYRSGAVQYIFNVDTPTGLDQVKQLLVNGYVVTFGTYINSWQYSTISSGALAGKKVMHWMNGSNGGHAMTIVGYDDNAWVDINGNNTVDTGEMGVLKIANSWGTGWGINGFMYMAYDALKATSAVPGGPSLGRQPAFQSKMVYHQPPRTAYTPKYLAKFSVKHALRNQMSLSFGWSSSTGTSASSTYSPFALMNKGGAYAFDGSTTAQDATFVMDVSDLPFSSSSANKLYLTFKDSTSGTAGYLNSFELIDLSKSGTSAVASAGITSPKAVDAGSTTVSLTYSPGGTPVVNQAPVARITASGTSGIAPYSVTFNGGTSSDPDGTIVSYAWNFGDGSTASGATASKTYSSAGTYPATLTVTDDKGAKSSSSVTITVSASIPTPTDTTLPTVSITSPVSGSRSWPYTTVYAAASASDNVGVTKVVFKVNDVTKCTDYTAPYGCSFTMYFSTARIQAWAYDAAGNVKSSSNVYVYPY